MANVYWNPNTKQCFGEFQLIYRTEEELAQLMEIPEEIWDAVLDATDEGKVVGVDPDTKLPIAVDPPEPSNEEVLNNDIQSCKQYLFETDWKVIKCMELGLSLSEVYPEDAVKREEARAKINESEAELLTLNTQSET